MTTYLDPVDKREGSGCLSQGAHYMHESRVSCMHPGFMHVMHACMNPGCHCSPTGKMKSDKGEADIGKPYAQRSILTGR